MQPGSVVSRTTPAGTITGQVIAVHDGYAHILWDGWQQGRWEPVRTLTVEDSELTRVEG